VRLADNAPLSVDESYLPRDIGERILENNLETEPIFSLLEQKYDTPLVEEKYRLEAISADRTVAEALGIAQGSPIFLIERTSYTIEHTPIDYEKLYYRGDQIRFRDQARAPAPNKSVVRWTVAFMLWLFAVSVVASAFGGMLGMPSGIFNRGQNEDAMVCSLFARLGDGSRVV
jgi:hypothetical protein